MSDPVPVLCPADTWTLVAAAARGGTIHRQLTTPTKYAWAYRVPDGIPPTDESDGVVVFTKNRPLMLPFTSGIDIYIYPYEENGSVRTDIIDPEIGVRTNPGSTVDTVRQSNTSAWNDFYFVQANGPPTTTTAAVPTAGDTRILSVASIANISIGDWLGVFSGDISDPTIERYYWAEVLDINVLDLTMQTPIDYTFPIGSTVLSTIKNMNVDGSVTPQVFSIQAGGAGGDLEIDISRVMLALLCEDSVNLSTFADILGGLDRGMFLRVKENGVYRNKCIIKQNYDFAKFGFDWVPFQSTNPNQGQDGMKWRFSLGGEDKHDAFSRVSGGNIGTLEWVVQDDLTSITLIESVGANSEVTP